MSRIRNGYFVAHLLGPFAAMSDDERADAYEIDPADEGRVKQLIATTLKPEFDRYDDASREILRQNLSYFLTAGTEHWKTLFDMYLPPIDSPDDPRLFFVWLWEVLFPGEDYTDRDVANVNVVNDIDALGVLRAKRV